MIRRTCLQMVAGLLASLSLAAPTRASVIWTEAGDAGDLPGTAQITQGTGVLSSIVGTIDNTAFEDIDMYQILITDPGNFSAGLSSPLPGGLADTYLFLFDSTGIGVAADNDTVSAPFNPISEIPVGTLTGEPAGLYYLAVSTGFAIGTTFDGDLPLDNLGNLIFDPLAVADDAFPLDASGAVGPDPTAGSIDAWQLDLDDSDDGPYTIGLTGASFASSVAIPEPASIVTWGLAAACCGAYRVRHRSRRRERGAR